MINKPIEKIELGDVQALIADAVPEGRTIDYKLALYGNSDADTKEFLADVSSFANTAGGDLLVGVSEDSGVPTGIVGVKGADEDAVKLRLENVIRDGIEPRIQADVRFVGNTGGPRLLLLRVKRSWLQPHRVIYKGHDKFYARNSAGKYQMDTSDLRVAFTTADRVNQQIGEFVRRRLAELAANVTPLPFNAGPKVVLHLLPLEAFTPGTSFPVLDRKRDPRVEPIYAVGGWSDRINLDGLLVHSSVAGMGWAYNQFYRSGIIEAVSGGLVYDDDKGNPRIPSITFEEKLLDAVGRFLSLQSDLGVAPPVSIRLALLAVKGFRMGVEDEFRPERGVSTIDRDDLVLPDIVIEDLSGDPQRIVRPLFDLVWNACGYPGSPYFDASGKWVGKAK